MESYFIQYLLIKLKIKILYTAISLKLCYNFFDELKIIYYIEHLKILLKY